MTIALARRYRPKRFADLLVQDHVAAVLRGAVARGRVGHGYLLTGPRGVGKTTAARILAMALNCPNRDPSGDPCGECDNCLRVWNGSANLDVVEIDAASNRGVDDARDLRERAMYAASREGHFKVYIVDEAHMLTREAWNALLKVLEEPPPGVVFVFATTEPQKIAAAAAPVLSRLQRFDFRRIGPGAIRDRLRQVLEAEGIAADDDALTLIARHADGGMRDALSVLDQCLSFGEGTVTAGRVREVLGLVGDELFVEVLALVVERRPEGVFPLVDRLVDAGADLAEFMAGAGEALRALLMLQLGQQPRRADRGPAAGARRPARSARAGRCAAHAAAVGRQRARHSAQREPAADRGDAAAAVDDAGPHRGPRPSAGRGADTSRLGAGGSASGGGGAAVRSTPSRAQARPSSQPTPPAGLPAGTSAPSSPSAAISPARSPDAVAPDPVAPAGPALGSVGALALETMPATLDAIRMAWGDVVAEVRRRSRFLGEALSHTAPRGLELPWLTVELSQPNPLFAERLQAQAQVVEEVVAGAIGEPVRLRVTESTPGPDEPASRPQRLSEASLKADRLRTFRSKDPTLDTAADALDLEIVD